MRRPGYLSDSSGLGYSQFGRRKKKYQYIPPPVSVASRSLQKDLQKSRITQMHGDVVRCKKLQEQFIKDTSTEEGRFSPFIHGKLGKRCSVAGQVGPGGRQVGLQQVARFAHQRSRALRREYVVRCQEGWSKTSKGAAAVRKFMNQNGCLSSSSSSSGPPAWFLRRERERFEAPSTATPPTAPIPPLVEAQPSHRSIPPRTPRFRAPAPHNPLDQLLIMLEEILSRIGRFF